MADGRPPRRRAHKKKPTERAILGEVRILYDIVEGGEMVKVKALVPAYQMDKRALQDRGLRVGDIAVMDVFKERNYRFYRLWHQLAGFLVENVDKYSGLKHHDCLKQLQLDSRIHCELRDFQLADGATLRAWDTKSLNFFDTDETEAQGIWTSICDYVAQQFFPDWDEDQIAEAVSHWERDQ